MFTKAAVAAALLGVASARPAASPAPVHAYGPGPYHQLNSVQKRDLQSKLGTYEAPSPSDSRAPCPALNTLANHGLLPRDGRNIPEQVVIDAFAQSWGIAEDGIDTALKNFGAVCEYVNNGVPCLDPSGNGQFLFTNLTLLSEPHAFEHDHSFSRGNIYSASNAGGLTNNIEFNTTIFQTSLDVIGYQSSYDGDASNIHHADYLDFNQIRLQRESLSLDDVNPGMFQEAIPTQEFEAGFIFGATFDRDVNGRSLFDPPLVRVDWWDYWFRYENFPTQLGWVPAPTGFFKFDFITSVSSGILAASPTSTPNPLPSGATNPSQPAAAVLPSAPTEAVIELIFSTPYANAGFTTVPTLAPQSATLAPTVSPNSVLFSSPPNKKRAPATDAPTTTAIPTPLTPHQLLRVAAAPAHITASAKSMVGPAPPRFDFYQQEVNAADVNNQVVAARSYAAAVGSAVLELL